MMRRGNLVDGRAVAREILETLRLRLERGGRALCLHALVLGDDPSSAVYLRSIKRACGAVGCRVEITLFGRDEPIRHLKRFISRLSDNPRVDGILVLGPARRRNALIQHVHPAKDVEGIHPANLGRLFGYPTGPLPPTAVAVMHILGETRVHLRGKNAVIVGASDIVGKPLALMLVRKYATPELCHIYTNRLREHTTRADILISAAGVPRLIRADMVKPGAVVIDVGVNQVNGRVVGDVDFEQVKQKASLITPVPGGVGPVTTAMLLRNLVELAGR